MSKLISSKYHTGRGLANLHIYCRCGVCWVYPSVQAVSTFQINHQTIPQKLTHLVDLSEDCSHNILRNNNWTSPIPARRSRFLINTQAWKSSGYPWGASWAKFDRHQYWWNSSNLKPYGTPLLGCLILLVFYGGSIDDEFVEAIYMNISAHVTVRQSIALREARVYYSGLIQSHRTSCGIMENHRHAAKVHCHSKIMRLSVL